MITRLHAVTASVKIRGGQRSVCRRARRAITSRMFALAKTTMAKKVEHLLSCPYLSLTADESDTYSFSAPLAAALQGCSPLFQWANLFIGQTDVAADKTGAGMYVKLRELLDAAHPDLFELIFFSCFDGCSSMRSIPLYAGLDSYPAGISLHAQLKNVGRKPLLGNLHGLCHLCNLLQKKGF